MAGKCLGPDSLRNVSCTLMPVRTACEGIYVRLTSKSPTAIKFHDVGVKMG